MNNELIRNKKELEKKTGDIYYKINKIENLLKKSAGKFKSEESLQALKEISEYLKLKQEEEKALSQKFDECKRQIIASCKHEILISNYNQEICMICGRLVCSDKTAPEYYLVETNYRNEIYSIINKIAEEDKDIMDVFEDYITKSKMLEKVRIYRRTR